MSLCTPWLECAFKTQAVDKIEIGIIRFYKVGISIEVEAEERKSFLLYKNISNFLYRPNGIYIFLIGANNYEDLIKFVSKEEQDNIYTKLIEGISYAAPL